MPSICLFCRCWCRARLTRWSCTTFLVFFFARTPFLQRIWLRKQWEFYKNSHLWNDVRHQSQITNAHTTPVTLWSYKRRANNNLICPVDYIPKIQRWGWRSPNSDDITRWHHRLQPSGRHQPLDVTTGHQEGQTSHRLEPFNIIWHHWIRSEEL